MWETKCEGEKDPIASSRKKTTVKDKSRRVAKKDKVEHVIHNMDGKIIESDSYGNDPNPPKDKKH